MTILQDITNAIGPENVLTGTDMTPWARDWIGKYESDPLAVLRPRSIEDVSAIMRIAQDTATPVVPVSGNTGLNGGAQAPTGSLLLSLDRMNSIRAIKSDAMVAVVDGGVVLETLHNELAEQDLRFPMSFGAKGSCMIAGMLATNAGGSNVLRFGNMRALCLGIEAVLPGGEVLNLMSELHKDNSGYDLRDLIVGSEGTLAVITGAVLKLVPEPKARATALLAVDELSSALSVLNALQSTSNGSVEACEYMPRVYLEAVQAKHPDLRLPLDTIHEANILIEIASNAPRDVTLTDTGELPLTNYLEEILATFIEDGKVLDATIARNEAQRTMMWEIRESAAEVILDRLPVVNNDIALPLDQVAPFLERMPNALARVDAEATSIEIAHLGDGNIHYAVFPSTTELVDATIQVVEEIVSELGGSFSAEHGIGLSKLPSMQRLKDPTAMATMALIKSALDPKGIMNPGKLLPEPSAS